MKHNIFKIRKLGDPIQARQPSQIEGSGKKVSSDVDQLKTTVQQTNEKMLELMTLFETFMKTSIQQTAATPKEMQLSNRQENEKEVRDRYVHLPLPESVTASKEEQEKWMTDVCIATFSTSFHYYLTEQMTFEQTKVFCSENILRNMLMFTERFKLTDKDIENLNSHIGRKVLEYLQKKYPLTQSNDVNKALEKEVQQTNHLDLLTNDFLHFAGIMFKYSPDGNYNDTIMRVINKAIEIAEQTSLMSDYLNDQKGRKEEETNYSDFQNFMEGLFQSVYDEDWMNGSKAKAERTDSQATYIAKKVHAESHKEKYEEKVKGYTNYLIGRKISENTVPYTEEEIKSKNLIIKSPAILRILTKWCEQLWQKFDNETYFTERTEAIQLQNPEIINPFFKWMKTAIDTLARTEKKNIIEFKTELDRNSYNQQSGFLLKNLQEDGVTNIPKYEKASGKFARQMVKNLHSYITLYLNRLIHGLLTVSKTFYDKQVDKSWDDWQSPPNLMTFKIGDLIRCKMSSKEKEIVKVFKELKLISTKNPKKLKIVRIKNRLKQGTNDILINIKFNNMIICEIQLEVINKSKSKFIQCSNSFSHYIYEMKRSIFGPVSQLCNIWNNFEARASEYETLINTSNKEDIKQQECIEPNAKHSFVKFDLPFQCSFCQGLYYHNNYIIPNKKCNTCSKYQCVKCQISQMEEEELKKTIFTSKKDKQLKQSAKRFKGKTLPAVGVCVKIESTFPNIEVFKLTRYEGKTWLLGKKEGQIYNIKRIKSPKDTQETLEKYCIFEITKSPTSFINITEKMAQNFSIEQYMKEAYKQEKEVVILTQLRYTVPEMIELMKVDGGYERNKKKVKRLQFASNYINNISYFSCFENLTSINLDYNQFVDMSDISRFKSLQKLEMRENQKLVKFNDQICTLTKLEEIKITNCRIPQLPEKIGDLALLGTIKMDKNLLTQLPASICNITNIKEISIMNNQLASLPEDVGRLVSLKKLMLKKNNLAVLPTSIGQLSSLQILELSSNKLTSLPDNLMYLSKLQVLRISDNQLEVIPPTLLSNQSLRQLCLTRNKLKAVPQAIKGCKNLSILMLDHNQIEIVPESLSQCIHLTELALNANKISVFPASFNRLTRLSATIVLSQNCLTAFPSFILEKQQVVKINLQNNQIVEIPEGISKITALASLKLANNKIQTVPQALAQLTQPFQLTLSNNQITTVPHSIKNFCNGKVTSNVLSNIFANNKISYFESSEIFDLMGPNIIFIRNEIIQIPMSVISNKSIITTLDFSFNKIKEIPRDINAFTGLTSMNLRSNLIKVVPKELQEVKSMQKNGLNLLQNPLQVVQCLQYFVKIATDATKKILKIENGTSQPLPPQNQQSDSSSDDDD